jgi:hypothetical protein
LAADLSLGQLQPQPPPQHEPPEPDADPDEVPPLALLPFPCAAKTESWIVLFALSHLGHVMAWFWFITMRS